MVSLDSVDLLVVLLAAVANMAVGALWYAPALFGKMWMQLSGLSMQDIEKAKHSGMAWRYLAGAVAAFLMAFVMGHILIFTQVITAWEAVTVAFWIWLGFFATASISMVLWEGKPLKLWLLNNGYMLTSLIVMSVILVTWQ